MSNTNPLLKRYPPNNRFINGAFKDQKDVIVRIDNFGDSVVDKESYRLSLAGKRGQVNSLGNSSQGWYMFPDGKYEANKDFSYIYRKDLSVVEIDNYIKNMESELKTADEALANNIKAEIEKAKEAKEKAIAKDKEKTIES